MVPERLMAPTGQDTEQIWHGFPHSYLRLSQFRTWSLPPNDNMPPSGHKKRQKNRSMKSPEINKIPAYAIYGQALSNFSVIAVLNGSISAKLPASSVEYNAMPSMEIANMYLMDQSRS